MKTIALVPVFNEAKNIVDVLNEIEEYVDEILIVNDASWDDSEKLITGWFASGHAGQLITLNKNKGNAAAIISGYAFIELRLHAGTLDETDIIVTIDADGQHKPSDIPRLVDFMVERDLDMVRGRRSFAKYPRHKRLGNRLLSWVLSIAAGQKLRDSMSGFCVQRAYTIEPLLRYATGYRYAMQGQMTVILPRVGYKISDEPLVEVAYFQSHTRYRDVVTIVALTYAALFKAIFKLDAGRRRRQWANGQFDRRRKAA